MPKNPYVKVTKATPMQIIENIGKLEFHEIPDGKCWYYCTLCEQYEVMDDADGQVVGAYDDLDGLLSDYPDAMV